jgi:hypothetical protein
MEPEPNPELHGAPSKCSYLFIGTGC